MAEQDRGTDDPQLAAIARHALHDEELIAAFAAGDVEDPAEAERARSLVERCPTCQEIHHDLHAIRAVTRASGTAAQRAQAHPAPRDFRLTAEDAARLRPASPATRLAVRLGWRARLRLGIATFGRPVGAAMTTFGIAGLLVGSLALGSAPLAGMGGSAAGAPAAPSGGPVEIDTASRAPAASVLRASYGPQSTRNDGAAGVGQPGDGTDGREGAAGRTAGPTLLLGASLALVIVGIVLVAASRRSAGAISTQRGN